MRLVRPLGAAAIALIGMAGCAQQTPAGYYDPQRGNSITDSQYTGQGAQYRNVVNAPSQLQIALDRDGRNEARIAGVSTQRPEDAPAASQAEAQPVAMGERTVDANGMPVGSPAVKQFAPQARTYAGTLPCLASGMQCMGQQMVLTIAPNGRWRARLAFIDLQGTAGKPTIEQGCWDATLNRPILLRLTDMQGNTRADFESVNGGLRVRSMDGQIPNMNYTLARQPDLDPIDGAPAAPGNCG